MTSEFQSFPTKSTNFIGGIDDENHHPRQAAPTVGILITIAPYRGLMKFLISTALVFLRGNKSAREPLFSMTKSASFLCSSPESWLAILFFASQGEVNKLFKNVKFSATVRTVPYKYKNPFLGWGFPYP